MDENISASTRISSLGYSKDSRYRIKSRASNRAVMLRWTDDNSLPRITLKKRGEKKEAQVEEEKKRQEGAQSS